VEVEAFTEVENNNNQLMPRSIGLDIIRAVAIFLVMAAHGIDIIYPFIPGFFGNIIQGQFGFLGVQLFFVLSGFLIGKIFIKTYEKSSFSLNSIFHFWIRRWFRTIPNYFLFLLIYVLVGIYLTSSNRVVHWNLDIGKAYPIYYYTAFLQNLFVANGEFFSQTWSLTIEEWFYFLLPLFFLFCYKIRHRKISSIKLVAAFILINWVVKTSIHLYAPHLIGTTVLYGLDSIIYGVLIASITLRFPERVQEHRKILFFTGLFIFATAELLFLKGALKLYPFFAVLTSVAFAFQLPFLQELKINNRAFVKIITTISQASYTIYLSNFLVLLFIVDGFIKRLIPVETAMGAFMVFFLYMLINSLIAYLHYLAFEVPVMNLREKRWITKHFINESTKANTL
jgi:peptidoglycan/LPS O-acetylase OafA/YrhL